MKRMGLIMGGLGWIVAAAVQAAEVKGITIKTVVESDPIRVRYFCLEPGSKTKIAERKNRVYYAITDEHLLRHYADGTTKEEKVKAGTWRVGDLGTYAYENIGKDKGCVYIVDLSK
jgi:hypothetical protein